MPDSKIHTLIEKSNVLTKAERAYWLASLPKMTPDQVSRLETILKKAAQIPWNEQLQHFLSFVTKAATVAG